MQNTARVSERWLATGDALIRRVAVLADQEDRDLDATADTGCGKPAHRGAEAAIDQWRKLGGEMQDAHADSN